MAKLVYCTEGFFKYEDVSHSLPYHTEEEWLSWCIVLKGFLCMKMLAIVYHTMLKKNG